LPNARERDWPSFLVSLVIIWLVAPTSGGGARQAVGVAAGVLAVTIVLIGLALALEATAALGRRWSGKRAGCLPPPAANHDDYFERVDGFFRQEGPR
jgi:hypothetical protein